MAVDVRFEVNGVEELKRKFGRYRQQLPFAEALALTRTAQDVRDAEIGGATGSLQRPVPFTVRGFGIKTAKKTDLEAKAFVKDIQAGYLQFPIEGKKSGKRIRPGNIRLNKYGNMPRKALDRLLARPDVFYGTIRGYTGIWQRGKARGATGFTTEVKASRGAKGQTKYKFKEGAYRNVRLIALQTKTTKYPERFKFYEIGNKEVQRVYLDQFAKALNIVGSRTFARGGGLK